MALLVGDKDRFAVEVGEWSGGILRRMDLWLGGQWLTCDDNWAFVLQVTGDLDRLASRIRSGGGPPPPYPGLSAAETHRRLTAAADAEDRDAQPDRDLAWRHRILDWGPTTDNIGAHWFREADQLTLTAEFWREAHFAKHPEHVGAVFAAEIGAAEFAGILEEVAELFHREPRRPADAGEDVDL